jgi:transposase
MLLEAEQGLSELRRQNRRQGSVFRSLHPNRVYAREFGSVPNPIEQNGLADTPQTDH